MKERVLFLAVFCFIGLGACFFAYKHGPISFSKNQQQQKQVSPGWAPPVTPSSK